MEDNFSRRFWAKVVKTKSCWNWVGCLVHGYGQFSIGDGKRIKSHRWTYEKLVGPIPKGLVIDHLCRNRSCVRPDHLRATTQRENILSGVGMCAINSRKIKCKRGHPFTNDNIYLSKKGRECLTCKMFLLRQQRVREKIKKASAEI